MTDLVIKVCSPEALDGTAVKVSRKQRRGGGPDLIDVLDDDYRLGEGLTLVGKHRDLVVHGVVLGDPLPLGAVDQGEEFVCHPLWP